MSSRDKFTKIIQGKILKKNTFDVEQGNGLSQFLFICLFHVIVSEASSKYQ